MVISWHHSGARLLEKTQFHTTASLFMPTFITAQLSDKFWEMTDLLLD